MKDFQIVQTTKTKTFRRTNKPYCTCQIFTLRIIIKSKHEAGEEGLFCLKENLNLLGEALLIITVVYKVCCFEQIKAFLPLLEL